ncbi:MAG: class I SAM-dependent methyltransferase [Candidatus Nomurabacteria bacterium]|nr:class I SAM-dependent methyltransferase [Candidatus Nomurabacteria bacterium]
MTIHESEKVRGPMITSPGADVKVVADKNPEYNGKSEKYVEVTEQDRIKRFVQFKEFLRLIGDVNGKKVLDVGCGNGKPTRDMARMGAEVIGYDVSEELINIAKKIEEKTPLGIKYFAAGGPPEGYSDFDLVSAVMVLPCAENQEQLNGMFHDAYSSLKDKGRFVSILLNPEFKRLGEIVCNRRFTKREDGRLDANFFNDNGTIRLSVIGTAFSKEVLLQTALQAGFKDVRFEPLHVQIEDLSEEEKAFFVGFEEDCPYMGLVCTK